MRKGLRSSVPPVLLALVLFAGACGPREQAVEDADAPETGREETELPATERPDEESPATESPTEQATDCVEPDKVRIAIPFHPPKFAFSHADITKELGYFDDFCVEAEIVAFRSGLTSVAALAAGELDVATTGSSEWISAVGQGGEIVAFFSSADKLPQLILATEGVASCEDFRGRTVATEGPGGFTNSLMATYLATCGLELGTDVEVFVGSPGDFGPQLAQGVAQGSALHADDKMLIERTQGIELTALANTWELLPDWHLSMFAATTEYAEESRDVLVRVTAALLKANRWMTDTGNRDDVIDVAASVTERDADIIEFAYETYGDSLPTSCDEALRDEALTFTMEQLVELGELEAAYPVEDVVDRSICQDAEELLP